MTEINVLGMEVPEENVTESFLCWEHWMATKDESRIIQAVSTSVPTLLAIFPNMAVITTVFLTESLRKKSFNIWVVSLAIADMLFAITIAVMNTLGALHHKFDYSTTLFWMDFNGALSYFTFIGVNLDRTYCIKKPMLSYGQSNQSVYKKISVCWVLAFFQALPFLFDTTLEECEKHCTSCFLAVDNKPLMWWQIITGNLAPILIILAVWAAILQELRKTSFAVQPNSQRDMQNRRVVNVMGLMTCAFLACSFPLMVTLIHSVMWRPTTSKWAHLSYTASFFNSIINPILYLSVSKQARQGFRALVCCNKQISTNKQAWGDMKDKTDEVEKGEAKMIEDSNTERDEPAKVISKL